MLHCDFLFLLTSLLIKYLYAPKNNLILKTLTFFKKLYKNYYMTQQFYSFVYRYEKNWKQGVEHSHTDVYFGMIHYSISQKVETTQVFISMGGYTKCGIYQITDCQSLTQTGMAFRYTLQHGCTLKTICKGNKTDTKRQYAISLIHSI